MRPMQTVTCQACQGKVLAEKRSWMHTQIQWNADTEANCPEIQAEIAAGREAGLVRRCTSLHDSLRQAIESGDFFVPDDEHPLPENDY